MLGKWLEGFERAMDPIPCPQPFNDESYIYEVKWDGVRILAAAERARLLLVNKRIKPEAFAIALTWQRVKR